MERPKNDKLSEVAFRRTAVHVANGLVCALLSALLVWGASAYPALVESVFRPFSRFILNLLAYVSGVLPISLAEILLGLLVLTAIGALVFLGVRLVRGPRRLAALFGWLARVLSFASSMVLAFYLLWGLNYHAPPLAETMSLPVRPRSATELAELTLFLAMGANALAPQVPRGADGLVPSGVWRETAAAVAEEFSEATGRPEVAVKPILLSKPLSHMQVSGIFIAYTGEANVNKNNVATDLPFTMAHELAHRYAIAPENEANFYAFYVLHDSKTPLLAYSAHLAALRMAHNALAGADAALYAEVTATYSELVLLDLREYSRHWSSYDGKVAEASAKVYNTYLVTQGQDSGIKSYGEMVDLLLAWRAVSAE